MTGQDAVNTAKAFHDVLNFDGVVLTKLDGDTREEQHSQLNQWLASQKFVGIGEKLDALDIFILREWLIEFLVWVMLFH